MKIKSLLKEDIDIDEEIEINCPGEMEIMKLKTDVDSLGISQDAFMLLLDSRGVFVHIAGYTAKKYLKKIKSSSGCKMHITGSIDMENRDQKPYGRRVARTCLSVAILHLYFYIIIALNYGINMDTTRFFFKRKTCRRILEIFKYN